MKVTYNWLKEFVSFDLPPQELADLLTMLGLEVEGMESIGGGLDDVVVARILERRQHPNADRLSLCKVTTGSETLDIVCGATNMQAGDTVALAKIGAVLPGDFTIKKSKIRGEESFGMLCSEKELGLAEESAGIMILPGDLSLGEPVFTALGLKDTVFEIGLTPNRPDCLSVVGIAREIAAKLNLPLQLPAIQVPESGTPVTSLARVDVEDSEGCPRYAARYIGGVTIAPSPAWLVKRLQMLGMRSINNVVDVTNYVLLEYGHPLHAFDYDLLAEGRIVVRRAAAGECFTTLDGQERQLAASDLTICDGARPVALAGVMGGENSEINPQTSNVLLESAYFAPMGIRRTAKRLGLHTESSHRFERGTDIVLLTRALDRAASLIAELGNGSVASGIIDVYPHPAIPRQISLRPEQARRVIGLQLSQQQMVDLLSRLEFTVGDGEGGALTVAVPSHRVDIEREIDLIEELARLYGYEQIQVTMPQARLFSDRPSRRQTLERQLRNFLVGQGLHEIITYSFIDCAAADRLLLPAHDQRRCHVALRNPLADDQSVMRTQLLPGMLGTARRNISHRVLDLRLFEMGRVFRPLPERDLPAEPLHLAILLSGRRHPEVWCQSAGEVDFYDLKGEVEALLGMLRLPTVTFKADAGEPFLHPGKSACLLAGTECLGVLGELHPHVLAHYDLQQPVLYAELDLERLIALANEVHGITPPSRFPDTTRDVALLLDADISADEVLATARKVRGKEIVAIDIFDLYTGSGIPAGKKSMALRVRYQSYEGTLSDEQVTPVHQRLVETLVRQLGATVR